MCGEGEVEVGGVGGGGRICTAGDVGGIPRLCVCWGVCWGWGELTYC